MYDLIIIGGGPGGVAAGVYAARKKIKTLLIAENFGGQSLVSADVQNWIGIQSMSGFELGKMLEAHVRSQEDIEILVDDLARKVEKRDKGFRVSTREGKTFETRYLLIASGSRRRKLNVPGEKELNGKGVVYCSTCDAPLFKGKTVAVVGGGNSGLEAVVDLLPYAAKVYLIVLGETLKGDQVTQEKIKQNANVQIICNAATKEILGKEFVTGLVYEDQANKTTHELALEGVFVEIGSVPNSDFVKGLVEVNPFGEIVVDHKTQQTSAPGIWAVGDVSDVLYKQNNVSAGDAIKAALNIYDHLNTG